MEYEGYLQGIEKMNVSSGTAPPVWRGGWMEGSSGSAALSRGGGGTEELAVLVGERGGTRARTPLRRRAFLSRREQLRMAPPSPALAKESGPSALHARCATPHSKPPPSSLCS
uniref:Uncharacterized protein n=1 Tax=Oryza rufipogon TaxID=4529 RepID=A0A0E0PW20_ORYRU